MVVITVTFCYLTSNSFAVGHWTHQNSNTLAWLHAVYFLNENKGWVVGSNGTLLTTDDGGLNWKTLKRPTEDNLLDVVFLNENEGWLLCESNRYQIERGDPRTYLLHTNDGSNWQRINLDGYSRDMRVTRIIFDVNRTGWLLGESGTFYKTDDGGNRWIGKPAPSRFLLLGGAMMNSQQGVLVGAASTIVYTNDGGITWRNAILKDNRTTFKQTSVTNKETNSIRFTSVSFADSQRGWAVGYNGQIYTSNDSGKTWYAQNTDVISDLYDVKFLNQNEGWIAGNNGTMLYTNNRGYIWERINSGTTHRLERIFFITPERGWIVGFGGTILTYSTDNKNPQLKDK